MKMNRRFPALLLAMMLLLACAAPAYAETDGTHEITARSYTTYAGRTEEEKLNQEITLYFVDGVDDLPYMELNDWGELLYFVCTDNGDEDYGLSIEHKGDVVIYERENGYTMEFDFANDTLHYTDYDAFAHGSNDSTLIDLVSEKGTDENGNAELIMRDKLGSFDRYGDEMIVNLADYDIHMIAQDGGWYVPLQTLCDFTLLPQQVSFVFNGQALFVASDNIFYDYSEQAFTEMADIYYSAPTGERSRELAEYSYNELCLLLDTFYGLKEAHDIQSFRQLFWQIGFDEVLSGTSAVDADNALKQFIDYYLDDLHSGFDEYSYLVGFESVANGDGIARRKYGEHSDAYSAARAAAYPDGWLSYEEVGNTAYITFDHFTSGYSGWAYYQATEEDGLDDTVAQIIDAHKQINREGSPIENVVLDLSNNSGGMVDAAVVVLSWFLGDAPFSVKNMSTGAMSTAVYRADINLDHVYDEHDTVADKHLYCLISPVSFSCGNLVPAALKSSEKVTLIGRTSGGGSCIVQPATTAYGTVFQFSAPQRMSFLKNGSFYDIDQGVDPDYYVDNIANLYNRQALTDFINGLF